MNNTRFALPLIAISLVVMMIAPGYALAADEVATSNITLEIDSEHDAQYDEVVNVAREEAITNPDTWDPAPQGIWLGASTEESLFKFDDICHEDNGFYLFHEVRFNSTQIMNGASVTIIRSPVHAGALESLQLTVYRLTSPGWDIYQSGEKYLPAGSNWLVVAQVDVDLADTSITTGADCWTVDGRIYVELHAPLYSGVSYVLGWAATYAADASPSIYLSSQDVANDNLTAARIGLFNELAPDNPSFKNYSWPVEPGISYDMINGLGNGLYAESIYVHAGDYLTWETSLEITPGGQSYYHTLMVPFVTEDHTLNATVKFTKASSNEQVIWTDSRTSWNDYILACSDTALAPVGERFARVNITFNQDTRVNLMFMDSPEADYLDNQAHISLQGIDHYIYARPWSSYQLSLGEVVPPSVNPADWPGMAEVQQNQQGNYYGTIIGVVMIVIGGVMVATGILAPIGFLVGGAGAVMLVADLDTGGNLLNGQLPGWLSNPIDAIWDTLVAIGEFLWAVGEALYDAITWIVDAVTEYLPILLGLLIIGVALALFFVPIYTQLKLWGIIWTLSEGKVQKAAAQAADLAEQAEGVYQGAKKVKGRLW